METSDSENFESADESLSSEDESTVVSKLRKLTTTENSPPKVTQLVDNKSTTDCNRNPDSTPKEGIGTSDDDNIWDTDWATMDDAFETNPPPIPDRKVGKLTTRYIEEEDVWETDGWEPLTKTNVQPNTNTWSGWSNWGVTTLLSSATTLTQGLSSVIESGIGIPQPEELANLPSSPAVEKSATNPSSGFGFGNLVSGVTKIVETTGNKVISSGLDTLETIGKKTMEVLQDGDPGLKKKRAFLQIEQDKPVLSQLLREAKEKAEKNSRDVQESQVVKKVNYESLFDDYQGLVHLEALEMLSKQCDIKLQTIVTSATGDELKDIQETLEQVKELCEIPDEDEDENVAFDDIRRKLVDAVKEINVPITYDRLISSWEETESWLKNLNMNVCSENELHHQAIETLAHLTAISVEQFHKAGELLLVKQHRSTADEADSLVQLTTTLTSLIGMAAAKFSDKLNSVQNKEEANSLITNIFFEAANSSSYIQDAFQLLIPVLQVGAV